MNKNTVHEPRNEAQNFLMRANKYKESPELFTLIRDENGNLIDTVDGNPIELSRKDELKGEGIEYLTSFVDFMCTHHKNAVVSEQGKYYSVNDISFTYFLDVVTGRRKNQRRRAITALYHIMKRPEYKLIRDESGDYYHMLPFTITLKLNGQAINEAMKRRLSNLKNKKEKDSSETIEGMVSTIDISFSKPLFEGFFKKGGHISMPTALYALVLDEVHNLAMLARGETKIPESLKEEYNNLYLDEENRKWLAQLDSPQSASEITNFFRYVCLHNNITSEQHKNKLVPFTVKTTLEIIPMLKEVAPRLIDRKNGKIYCRQQEFYDFLAGILAITSISDAFKEAADFRIIHWEIYDNDKIQLVLTNDKNTIYEWQKEIEGTVDKITAIREYTKVHPNATTEQIANSLDITQRTVQRYLKVINS